MAKAATPFEQPSFEFYPTTDDAIKQRLGKVEAAITDDPETQIAALSLMALGTEAVGKVLDFVDSQPKGKEVLRTWQAVFDERLDDELSFDEATEARLAADDTIKELQKDTKMAPELRRDKIRRRRFSVFAERMRIFKEADEAA